MEAVINGMNILFFSAEACPVSWWCASLAKRALQQRSLKICRENSQDFVFEGKEKQGNHVVASCRIRVARIL
ncbi:hypothetical protein B1757_12110 [Acidithiobacillus marinus]|uniref:Uncharacterized protein n=1 Tax=Acidithiobacillus marinus TaxID=187490 RepID=A0A2I1DJH7_9PROT|nr:hypothetical protein B1757_12110 [Acidithiobacillus marinus]